MDLCVLLLRVPSARWNELRDDFLAIPSGDVAPLGSLCGILGVRVDDQINGSRLALGERDETIASQICCKLVSGRVHWVLDRTAARFGQRTVREKRTQWTSSQPEPDATQNHTNVLLLSKCTTTCPRRSKVTDWPD